MRRSLKLHPDSLSRAALNIDVDVNRAAGDVLTLSFQVTGRVSELFLPTASVPIRAEGLWHHTCFEAFVKTPRSNRYYELNVAPSLQWALYRFDDYRNGMQVAYEASLSNLAGQLASGTYKLDATLSLQGTNYLPADCDWQLGLSAVVEEANGTKSYWALTHPRGKADFHHRDGFSLELPHV